MSLPSGQLPSEEHVCQLAVAAAACGDQRSCCSQHSSCVSVADDATERSAGVGGAVEPHRTRLRLRACTGEPPRACCACCAGRQGRCCRGSGARKTRPPPWQDCPAGFRVQGSAPHKCIAVLVVKRPGIMTKASELQANTDSTTLAGPGCRGLGTELDGGLLAWPGQVQEGGESHPSLLPAMQAGLCHMMHQQAVGESVWSLSVVQALKAGVDKK